MTTSISSKKNAAYIHGGMDFHAGAPLNPRSQIPPSFCSNLGAEQRKQIEQEWARGWLDAFTKDDWLQSLPDGVPA